MHSPIWPVPANRAAIEAHRLKSVRKGLHDEMGDEFQRRGQAWGSLEHSRSTRHGTVIACVTYD